MHFLAAVSTKLAFGGIYWQKNFAYLYFFNGTKPRILPLQGDGNKYSSVFSLRYVSLLQNDVVVSALFKIKAKENEIMIPRLSVKTVNVQITFSWDMAP
jgi:hypothetical protein